MKILATTPGKNGDLLWMLATVNQLSKNYGSQVDVMIMLNYKSLIPLLKQQPYIKNVIINEGWICTGSPHGDQPWEPQNITEYVGVYDKIHHLGYRYHPGIGGPQEALIDFVAHSQGINLENPIPFIEADSILKYRSSNQVLVGYSFNPEYKDLKDRFLNTLTQTTGLLFINVSSLPWEQAAGVIKQVIGFVGDCSANHVLACGVGQKNIFLYEPHPNRHSAGQFGRVFGCPYVNISSHPFGCSPEHAADFAILQMNSWKIENEKMESVK